MKYNYIHAIKNGAIIQLESFNKKKFHATFRNNKSLLTQFVEYGDILSINETLNTLLVRAFLHQMEGWGDNLLACSGLPGSLFLVMQKHSVSFKMMQAAEGFRTILHYEDAEIDHLHPWDKLHLGNWTYEIKLLLVKVGAIAP